MIFFTSSGQLGVCLPGGRDDRNMPYEKNVSCVIGKSESWHSCYFANHLFLVLRTEAALLMAVVLYFECIVIISGQSLLPF